MPLHPVNGYEFMKTTELTVGEFKSRFSEALGWVSHGEAVAVTYGRSRRPVALLVPPPAQQAKRKLGMLIGKVKIKMGEDWALTDEEFLGA
jgi:antitoxin (DNA-binding transcriptional repressor) of toxin-antitoxin stability system